MDAKYVLESVFQAVLGGTIQMLLERIASSDVVNFIRGKKDSDFQSLVKRLEIMMSSLTGVLDDAEQRQIRDDPRVESWLDEVQEAVFDAEDFLGEIEYEALRLKVTGDSGAGTSEVRESKRPKIFSFSRNSEDRDLENGIRNILDRLEEIVKIKEVLGLRETLAEKKQWQRPLSTYLVEESQVFGRDGDIETMLNLLLSGDDVSGRKPIDVSPIVGMGGVGKTTLAQTVFNHSRVKENFDLMLWVCVSENYDVHRTTSALLSSSSPDACDLNSLQVRLRDKLAGKKFLIVLDDVWNDNVRDWEVMRKPFRDGARGSKIIVTTRSQVVARITGTVPTHHLSVLTEEVAWKLFVKHAFGDELVTNPEFERIGREIMMKCKGLPLAVKTLGGLLHSNLDIDHWKGIRASEIWELRDSQSDILPALRLSYYCLPSHLKQCFSYCAIFPHDVSFEKEELISLWMAQNLLERPEGNMRTEDVGDQYFKDLLSMSFFQPAQPYNDRFVMHDLIVDLARYVSRKYCSRLEGTIFHDEVIKETTRHLAFCRIDDIICERLKFIRNASRVRTFLDWDDIIYENPCDASKRVLRDFFLKLKHLRALSFSAYHEKCGVPIDSICELRHLRFLKLSDLSIKHLPDSLCTLYTLRTLKVVRCESIRNLPKDIHQLSNLRHLAVYSSDIEELPESLSRLTNLQNLILQDCLQLNKLPKDLHQLNKLRYLVVSRTYALEELPESVIQLSGLQELSLQGCCELNKLSQDLRHLTNLIHLDVSSIALEELPESLGQMSNLQHLNLSNCKKIKKLPESLGLMSNLKHLNLSNCTKIKKWPESFHLLDLKYLNFDGSGLEDMPTQVSKLKGLQNLSTLAVGKDRDTGISELANFTNLRGKLCIKNLQNVEIPEDAVEVKLRERMHLDDLEFEWSSEETNDTRRGLEVLENLMPHTSLVKLKISGYGHTKFPHWLSHHSYWNLVSITLSNCNNCATLPQLGQLVSLENLVISRFDAVVNVGPEFYGTSISMLTKPFASLKELRFCDMRNWKEWSMPDGDDEAFPKLMKLALDKCDSLEGDFHRFVPSLEQLIISTCVAPSSCSLETLESKAEEYGFNLPSLKTLSIAGYDAEKLLSIETMLVNVTSLLVGDCTELKFLPENMHEFLPLLETLFISNCTEMESFPTSGLPLSLHSLRITNCDKLVASRGNWNLQALPNLESFTISEYESEDMESFPEQGLLPTTLTWLEISATKSLKSLNNEVLQQFTSLIVLFISSCPNLETMTEEPLPGSLEYFRIVGCPVLEVKCDRETGEYWNHIAHIPHISLDD